MIPVPTEAFGGGHRPCGKPCDLDHGHKECCNCRRHVAKSWSDDEPETKPDADPNDEVQTPSPDEKSHDSSENGGNWGNSGWNLEGVVFFTPLAELRLEGTLSYAAITTST